MDSIMTLVIHSCNRYRTTAASKMTIRKDMYTQHATGLIRENTNNDP
jgi:hypothetical protein